MSFIGAKMQRLEASVAAAHAACEVVETGSRPAVPRAWSGSTSDSDKRRLQGSIVTLKGKPGEYGYLPASSGAALFKSGKIKLSLTGGEVGNYFSEEEASAAIDKIWMGRLAAPGAAQLAAVESRAGGANGVVLRIEPVVGATFAELRVSSPAGAMPDQAIAAVAKSVGEREEDWQPWCPSA